MTTNAAMVALRELDRDVQASRAVYESFLVRARETGEQERLDTNNIRVISKADLPLRRSWPPSNLLVAFGTLFLGFATGTGIVLLLPPGRAGTGLGKSDNHGTSHSMLSKRSDWLPQAVEAKALAGFPVLAMLPHIEGPQRLNALEDPTSPFAAEMRKVHDAVRANHNKRTGTSILVIGSHDEDDATTVALNLASIAAATQRVLLIDADLHRRTLSAIVPDQTEGGLVDVAVGRKVLSDLVIRHQQSNINLMPFVSPNSRRQGKINDADVRSAFEQTKRFDVVIVAAMNFDRGPAARFFAGLVDHIVLVSKGGGTSRVDIDQIISTLGVDARNIRGTVLTSAQAA